MNDRIPYREEGEQAEPPEPAQPRVDHCCNCIHIRRDGGHRFSRCAAVTSGDDNALALVSGRPIKVSEMSTYCTHRRKKMHGTECPDFMTKPENELRPKPKTKTPWWKFWAQAASPTAQPNRERP